MRYYYLAQAYGEGAYGACTYQHTEQEVNGSCATGAGGTDSGSNGGGLVNTGVGIVAIVTLACIIIFVSLVVRVWRRPKLRTERVAADNQADGIEQSSDSQRQDNRF